MMLVAMDTYGSALLCIELSAPKKVGAKCDGYVAYWR
jgi:hypothetical protein